MAELSFVVNLAYLELKSLRYLKNAQDMMDEVKLGLNDRRLSSGASIEQFMELYTQVKNMFCADSTDRSAAWYVVNNGGKLRFKKCATMLFPLFSHEYDRRLSTGLLVISALSVFTITLISRLAPDAWQSTSEATFLWYAIMTLLTAGLVFPSAFIFLGREMKQISERIALDVKSRKAEIASAIMHSQLQRARPSVPSVFAPPHPSFQPGPMPRPR
ncbi:hypothetical protein [Ramlibacter albus]|uniref:Uncharacterized protein n=1 Tax=Ramlibacter albus TaxID=2079448 RepID=A0A923M759_9BURK|nr:hypothetical protein [Ramlibacter albus]MBC5764143.1 hypothetical protein [Ramlibacter albus]